MKTVAIFRPVSLAVIAPAVLISVINARLTDSELSSTCGQHNFYHPLRGMINCSAVCPPTVSTDVNVRFCSLNCHGKHGRLKFVGGRMPNPVGPHIIR